MFGEEGPAMKNEEKREALKEMFRFLKEEDLDFLVSTNDDINVLITRVLDNNYKPLIIDVKDIAAIRYDRRVYKKELHYPEVFANDGQYKNYDDVDQIRIRASQLQDEAHALDLKGSGNKLFGIEYVIEADKKREERDKMNRYAAILVMKKAIENRNQNTEYQSKETKSCLIDLHRLYVKEALDFVEDLYREWNFKEINFVTGRKTKNKTLRPALETWFAENGFAHYDLGAIIKGKKKIT